MCRKYIEDNVLNLVIMLTEGRPIPIGYSKEDIDEALLRVSGDKDYDATDEEVRHLFNRYHNGLSTN